MHVLSRPATSVSARDVLPPTQAQPSSLTPFLLFAVEVDKCDFHFAMR